MVIIVSWIINKKTNAEFSPFWVFKNQVDDGYLMGITCYGMVDITSDTK